MDDRGRPRAATHSLRSCASARDICYCIDFSRCGQGFRLDRCTRPIVDAQHPNSGGRAWFLNRHGSREADGVGRNDFAEGVVQVGRHGHDSGRAVPGLGAGSWATSGRDVTGGRASSGPWPGSPRHPLRATGRHPPRPSRRRLSPSSSGGPSHDGLVRRYETRRPCRPDLRRGRRGLRDKPRGAGEPER